MPRGSYCNNKICRWHMTTSHMSKYHNIIIYHTINNNNQIESVLRDILTPYKDSMLNEISKFEFQLNELETSIHSDLQVIENEYNTYRESRELNTMFIQ